MTSTGEYLFASGDFRWPRERIEALQVYEQVSKWFYNIFQPEKMFETNKFIVLLYSYQGVTPIGLIDKKTKKTFLAYKESKSIENRYNSTPYLKNDFDGGMSFTGSLTYYCENNMEYLCEFSDPISIKKYVSSDEFKEDIPKCPSKKEEFEKLANSLEVTGNPILIMAKLKSC